MVLISTFGWMLERGKEHSTVTTEANTVTYMYSVVHEEHSKPTFVFSVVIIIHVHASPTRGSSFFLGKVTALRT